MRLFSWLTCVALGVVCSLAQGTALAVKANFPSARETPAREARPSGIKDSERPLPAHWADGAKDFPEARDNTRPGARHGRREEDEPHSDRRFRFFVLLLQIFRAAK